MAKLISAWHTSLSKFQCVHSSYCVDGQLNFIAAKFFAFRLLEHCGKCVRHLCDVQRICPSIALSGVIISGDFKILSACIDRLCAVGVKRRVACAGSELLGLG
jgi:hypothetical protein